VFERAGEGGGGFVGGRGSGRDGLESRGSGVMRDGGKTS
nr:hypothetical protein [Tanacetum cinerariifolium]